MPARSSIAKCREITERSCTIPWAIVFTSDAPTVIRRRIISRPAQWQGGQDLRVYYHFSYAYMCTHMHVLQQKS